MKRYTRAFTMAELIMSVVVLSIVMLALAPVITKRVDDNITVGRLKTQGALFSFDTSFPLNCRVDADVEGANSDECSFRIPNHVRQINAIVIGSGGNGSAATSSGSVVTRTMGITQSTGEDPIIFHPTMPDSEDNNIEKPVQNLRISYIIGGGSGGGAGWGGDSEGSRTPASQEDCDPFDALFIPAEYNGTDGVNLCVTKFNAGDDKGPTLPDGITIITDGTTCSSRSAPCCWKGQTADPATCTATGNYPACNRTLCNTSVFHEDKVCSSWEPSGTSAGDWRSFTKNEIQGWIVQMNLEASVKNDLTNSYFGINGLQFCMHESGDLGASRCDEFLNENSVRFLPHHILSGAGGGLRFLNDNGNIKVIISSLDYSAASTAYSLRCALDTITSTPTANSGAGGHASFDLPDTPTPYTDIESGALQGDVEISVEIGTGGKGATSSSSATDGSPTEVSYKKYDSAGELLSSYSLDYGIVDGYGANGTSLSAGAIASAVRWIANTNIGRMPVEDSRKPSPGQTGVMTTNSTAPGGAGAGSRYEYYLNNASGNVYLSGGGLGGGASDPNGKAGTSPGAGGGGGTAILNEDGEVVIGNGGDGAPGGVVLSWEFVPTATAGHGGAGGGMVFGRNISVNPDSTLTASFDGNSSQLTIGANTILAYDGENASGAGPGAANPDGGIALENNGTFNITPGQDGFSGEEIPDTSFLYGGAGGASGSGVFGGCGGLNKYSGTTFNSDCTSAIISGVNGVASQYNVLRNLIAGGNFGTAGAGGGGGGFGPNALGATVAGAPGSGSKGYVYIWWQVVE